MDDQPGSTKSKGITETLIIPMTGPLMNGAGKVSEATQAGLLWGAKMLATDGGGTKISKHWGIAADYAARAWWGSGPVKNGGLGMAGGDARRAMIGTSVAVAIVAGVYGTSLYADYVLAKQPDRSPAAGTCENCQENLPVVPVAGGDIDSAAGCPRCGHGTSQA